ncbi:hypothetical protein R3P38DRAFT_2762256 [Favolaschia claudopus]
MTQTMLCSGHPNLASPPPPISLIDLIQRTPTGVRRLPSTPTVLCSLLQDVCRLQSIVCVDRPRRRRINPAEPTSLPLLPRIRSSVAIAISVPSAAFRRLKPRSSQPLPLLRPWMPMMAHLSGNWLYVLAFIVALVTSAM